MKSSINLKYNSVESFLPSWEGDWPSPPGEEVWFVGLQHLPHQALRQLVLALPQSVLQPRPDTENLMRIILQLQCCGAAVSYQELKGNNESSELRSSLGGIILVLCCDNRQTSSTESNGSQAQKPWFSEVKSLVTMWIVYHISSVITKTCLAMLIDIILQFQEVIGDFVSWSCLSTTSWFYILTICQTSRVDCNPPPPSGNLMLLRWSLNLHT